MENILKKIKEYNRIIIFGHERPDGDCIGSQYGLYYVLKESFPEKEVYVSGEVSEYVSFIGRPTMVDDSLFKGALAICVDCANGERLSDKRFKNCDYSIKIDHHINVDSFCDYEYVDAKAPACAQILTEFFLKFNDVFKITKEAAEALYVGIVTDTGRFKYDSTSPVTHRVAASLLEYGVNIGKIDNNLSIETIDALRLRGYCLNTFKTTENGFAYLIMTRDIINKFGVSDEDAANQVNAISTINECPVWAMFIEYPDQIRVRLRSRGPKVNILAEKYEGGGHEKASGAKLQSWDKLDEFLADADRLVKEYKNEKM